ncbi:MAG TPA: HEAT repeat domain-containing protein [Planctomycetota bacterium]|nr:HEAT repeat domain-containing protein [Planctomycetota bacterium]
MFGSGASGSGASREGYIERPRSARRIALGCLLVALVFCGVFWRQLAIGGCFAVARCSSSPQRVAWSSVALSHLGPSALPALARLLDRPGLQNWWSARKAIELMHKNDPEANAAIHDLLGSSSLRVRVAVATVLVEAHDDAGVPGIAEGLASDDPDLRFFSAETGHHLGSPDWSGMDLKSRWPVYEKSHEVLMTISPDTRTVFEHEDLSRISIEGKDTRFHEAYDPDPSPPRRRVGR